MTTLKDSPMVNELKQKFSLFTKKELEVLKNVLYDIDTNGDDHHLISSDSQFEIFEAMVYALKQLDFESICSKKKNKDHVWECSLDKPKNGFPFSDIQYQKANVECINTMADLEQKVFRFRPVLKPFRFVCCYSKENKKTYLFSQNIWVDSVDASEACLKVRGKAGFVTCLLGIDRVDGRPKFYFISNPTFEALGKFNEHLHEEQMASFEKDDKISDFEFQDISSAAGGFDIEIDMTNKTSFRVSAVEQTPLSNEEKDLIKKRIKEVKKIGNFFTDSFAPCLLKNPSDMLQEKE